MSNENHDIMEEQLAVLRTQKPYLINALREWCHDSGACPHILLDSTWPGVTGLPANLLHPQLVLNVSASATHSFLCDKDGISVSMNFSGVQRHLFLPIGCIRAIYGPEAGNVGMSFDSFEEHRPDEAVEASAESEAAPRPRPSFLHVVK